MSTIAFFPEGAYGPTNNCVGIGDVLRRRGHRVVFIVEESFAGALEAQGFEERLMRLAPPPEEPEVPGQFWKDFIRETAPVFRKPTIEQLGDFIAPTFQALIDGAVYVDDRLREIIDELEPDVIVEDNVVAFPALPACGRPWVRIVSCNPTEVRDPVELMQRLVDTLADAPWRVIVSMGPQHELLRLPDTMAGEEFLPQTTILPQVDAVITHGGNNTVTECFHNGCPMVVLPLFWDQYDNAQRVQETGYGLRVDTYGHAPDELTGAVERVLADGAMRERLAQASARLQAHRGTERAAERIEAVAAG